MENKSQSVQLLSRVQLFETPWIPARQASLYLGVVNDLHLLKHAYEYKLM